MKTYKEKWHTTKTRRKGNGTPFASKSHLEQQEFKAIYLMSQFELVVKIAYMFNINLPTYLIPLYLPILSLCCLLIPLTPTPI